MPTINIEIDENKYVFLKDDDIFQSVINEAISDYIEIKNDLQIKNELLLNSEFYNLNSKLEDKLWNL